MPCHQCGRTEGTLHSGEWISATSSEHKYSYLSATGQRVGVTRTTYANVAECRVALCDKCLAQVAKERSKTPFIAMSIALGVAAVILTIAASGPVAGTGFRVFAALFMGTVAGLLLWYYIATQRRYRRAELVPTDEMFLTDYASAVCKADGRDALFSPAQWDRLQEESARSDDDDPLNPRKIAVAIQGAMEAMKEKSQ